MDGKATYRTKLPSAAIGQRGLKGPAWRWRLAAELPSQGARRLMRSFDQNVRDAHDYRRLCRQGEQGRKRAASRYPWIAAAEAINTDPARVGQLKIAVLGELDRAEIARRFGLDQRAIEAWESLFFDARGAREQTGWIRAHVIQPEIAAGRDSLAARLKLVASAGPSAARAVLDADGRVPLDAAERLFDRRLKLHLKFDAAVAMPLKTDRQKMSFLRMYTDLTLRERRLCLEERELQERCLEALRKHERAKVRLERADKRAREREAKMARRANRRALRREQERQITQLEQAWQQRWHVQQQRAAAARAASSPLARLRWGASAEPETSAQVACVSQVPVQHDHNLVNVPPMEFIVGAEPTPRAVAVAGRL